MLLGFVPPSDEQAQESARAGGFADQRVRRAHCSVLFAAEMEAVMSFLATMQTQAERDQQMLAAQLGRPCSCKRSTSAFKCFRVGDLASSAYDIKIYEHTSVRTN